MKKKTFGYKKFLQYKIIFQKFVISNFVCVVDVTTSPMHVDGDSYPMNYCNEHEFVLAHNAIVDELHNMNNDSTLWKKNRKQIKLNDEHYAEISNGNYILQENFKYLI